MSEETEWFVNTEADRVYGPVGRAKLATWAREGRILPTSRVSTDRVNWSPAPMLRFLGMVWLVETQFGTLYGPYSREVAVKLFEDGAVPETARIYRLSDEGFDDVVIPAEPAVPDLSGRVKELEAVLDAAQAKAAALESEKGALANDLKVRLERVTELEATLKDVRSDLSAAKEASKAHETRLEGELGAARSHATSLEGELKDVRAQYEAVTDELKQERVRTAALEGERKESAAQVAALETKLVEADRRSADRAAALEKKLAEADCRSADQARALEEAAARAANLEATLKATADRAAALETSLAAAKAFQDAVESEQAEIESLFKSHADRLRQELQRQRAALQEACG